MRVPQEAAFGTIELQPKPLITMHPTGGTIATGGSITFCVSASSPTPVIYQWLFNGSPIRGATESCLAVANAQPIESGNYSVVVRNDGGPVTSSDAPLTVTSSGCLLLNETFSYPDGRLIDAAFPLWSGDGQVQVESGTLRLDTARSGGSVWRGCSTSPVKIFVSCTINYSARPWDHRADFVSLMGEAGGMTRVLNCFAAAIAIGAPSGSYRLGLGSDGIRTALKPGVDYVLALGFDPATRLATLWLDPVYEPLPFNRRQLSWDVPGVNGLALLETVGSGAMRLDNLRIGTCFDEVCGLSADKWFFPIDGKWEDSSKWSLGPPDSTRSAYITGGGNNLITIDAGRLPMRQGR